LHVHVQRMELHTDGMQNQVIGVRVECILPLKYYDSISLIKIGTVCFGELAERSR